MTGTSIEFLLNDKALRIRAKELGADMAMAKTKQLMAAIAGYGKASTLARFRKSVGPGGVPWDESKRGGQTLVKSGRLARSFGTSPDSLVKVTPTSAEWGTNVVYAGIHQFGGRTAAHVIKARRAKALYIPGIGFRKSVRHPGSNIPARPFLGLDAEDELAIEDIVETWLKGLVPA